jgi:membrane-bound ClpP family serine protease
MADHGTVEYATATGNDYPAHENTYERFLHFTFTGIFHVVSLLLGLAAGGVADHWFAALCIFILAIIGLVAGLLSGSRTPSYVAFVLCALIFLYSVLG